MKTLLFLTAVLFSPCFAGSIKLAIDPVPEDGPMGYTIEATPGDGTTDAAWMPLQSTVNLLIDITGLKPGPWAFRARAVTAAGITSEPSNVVTDIILPSPPGIRKIVLQTSRDLEHWELVGTFEVPEEDRAFYRIVFNP